VLRLHRSVVRSVASVNEWPSNRGNRAETGWEKEARRPPLQGIWRIRQELNLKPSDP
jgi:hypothetical protein